MRRRLAFLALTATATLALAVPAQGQRAQLLPKVSYETGVQFTRHGPVVLHIVRGPRPVGLYRLRPVLSHDSVIDRETVSAMQRRVSAQATSVGVNGDLFSLSDGRPSGITLRDGVLLTPPSATRSSAGVLLDGTLDVRRVGLVGSWRGLWLRRGISSFNTQPGDDGVALFTSDWGAPTPRGKGSFSVVLSGFTAATPNTELTAVVTETGPNASDTVAPGTAVLVARGEAVARLQSEAPVGTTISLRLVLQPDWPSVSDAIGGGPVLVRDGVPVFRALEEFTTSQLAHRAPRSAVGQRADGSVLLVATDGRQPGYSVGMTNFEMAQALVRLGAVSGMALDGGGSSTLAFEGAVLNRPSGGRERLVSNALMLQYFGVYAHPLAEAVVSPNGDGAADTQSLSFKVVRPSNVTVRLEAPDGSVAFEETALRTPGSYPVPFPPPPPEPPPPAPGEPPRPPLQPLTPDEGRWLLRIESTDDQGLSSSALQRFWVNSTLGSLRVQPAVLRPGGTDATIRWTQARPARVKVTVTTIDGVVIRVPARRVFGAGEQSVTWDGRRAGGARAAPGGYLVRVQASNAYGTVALERELVVR